MTDTSRARNSSTSDARQSETAQRFRFSVAIGIILSLLLGATEGRGADAPGNATTVLLAEGDNALSAAVQLGGAEAWATITVRLNDGKSHVFRGRVEPERIRKKATDENAKQRAGRLLGLFT